MESKDRRVLAVPSAIATPIANPIASAVAPTAALLPGAILSLPGIRAFQIADTIPVRIDEVWSLATALLSSLSQTLTSRIRAFQITDAIAVFVDEIRQD